MYNPIWLPPTEDPDKQFSMTDVVSAAFQVARAMEFLASRKVGVKRYFSVDRCQLLHFE